MKTLQTMGLIMALACPCVAADKIESPRDHHYEFAHKTLVAAMRQGKPFLDELEKKKDRYLRDLWRDAGKNASDGKKLSSRGLAYEVYDVKDDQKLVVVVLPKPETAAEAFMVGCVIAKDAKPDSIYTLEKAFGGGTMLCGWSGDAHFNMGAGPDPKPEAFKDAILKKISK